MINQNWWFTTLLWKQFKHCPPLNRAIRCDVAIVGGGLSGVSAAAEFVRQGYSVVLIEKNILGGSSTGRSAGFLTPDSELELHQLVRRYGLEAAREIWDMPVRGIDRLVQGIKTHEIECGLLEQDSLFLGIGASGKKAVASELECRQSVGFTDQEIYDEQELKRVIGAEGYTAGLRYTGTYGINPLLCMQGFKDVLHRATARRCSRAPRWSAWTITRCTPTAGASQPTASSSRWTRCNASISPLADELFHAQTFMSVTEPLTDQELRLLFPSGRQMQCWDSSLVYSYYRLTGDNRLLLGGGTALTTFLREAYNDHRVIGKVIRHFKRHFPFLKDLSFIQFWPGLIDTTRDLLPIIVKPPTQPHLQFILGIVGLPWAAFAGSFAAQKHSRLGRRRLQEVLPVLHEPPALCLPGGSGEDHREAGAVLAEQRVGKVLSGGLASKTRSREG